MAISLRLLLAHMTTTSKRLFRAMVLDGLGGKERATAFEAATLLKVVPRPETGSLLPLLVAPKGTY